MRYEVVGSDLGIMRRKKVCGVSRDVETYLCIYFFVSFSVSLDYLYLVAHTLPLIVTVVCSCLLLSSFCRAES